MNRWRIRETDRDPCFAKLHALGSPEYVGLMRADLPDEFLMPLGDALKRMPNVKPRLARLCLKGLRDDFDAAFIDALHRGEPWAEASDYEQEVGEDGQPVPPPADPREREVAPGVIVTPADVDGLFAGTTEDLVTPDGAALLVRLYEAGIFEPQRVRAGRTDPTELRAYAVSASTLQQRAAHARAEREAATRAYQERVRHPERLTDAEFTYKLLNDVFIARHGLRGGTLMMEIGGLQVTKEVRTYTSNSGSSRDSSVTFSWTARDGTPRELHKPSTYAGNRRNDAERNWGLGPA